MSVIRADNAAVLARRPSISILPDEILSNIFLILFEVCRDDELSKDNFSNWDFKDDTIFVTHVCKHWRSVALDYTPIWTSIIATSFSPEQINQYLIRSKNSKLSVSLSINIKDDSTILSLLRDHVWRIEEFYLYSENFTSSLQQSPFLLDTARNLQFLTLKCEDHHHEHFMPTLTPSNSKVTSCLLPSLRELKMIHTIPYSTLPCLNNITSLTLSNIESLQSEHILLRVLAQCSERLESLSLIKINFDFVTLREKGTPPTVNFLALRELTINRDVIFIRRIYPFVKFPKRLKWNMTEILYELRSMTGYDDLFTLFPTEIYPANKELKIMFDKMENDAECILAEKPVGFSDQSPINPQDIVITADADVPNVWQYTATVLFRLFSIILPPTISKLDFIFVFKFSADDIFGVRLERLKDMIKKMERVESLRFSLCGEGEVDVGFYVDLQIRILHLLRSTMVYEKEADDESGSESDGESDSGGGECENENESEVKNKREVENKNENENEKGSENGGGESKIKSENNIADMDNEVYWPKLEVFTLKEFHFGHSSFFDRFIDFLSTSIIPKRQIRLNIDDAYALSRDSIDKIRAVSANFYLDGVEVAGA